MHATNKAFDRYVQTKKNDSKRIYQKVSEFRGEIINLKERKKIDVYAKGVPRIPQTPDIRDAVPVQIRPSTPDLKALRLTLSAFFVHRIILDQRSSAKSNTQSAPLMFYPPGSAHAGASAK